MPSDDAPTDTMSGNAAPADAGAAGLPLPFGTVARISGLKTPGLNGELCQVLRPADSPDRVIVRTRFGEKSLKHTALEDGAAVYPKAVAWMALVLFCLTLLALADIRRSHGRSAPSAVVLPVIFMACLGLTLGLCWFFYRPCRTSTTWFITISEMGSGAPARGVYRSGFLMTALLLAVIVWLHSELLMAHLADIPPPSPPPPPPVPAAEPAEAAAEQATGTEEQSAPPEEPPTPSEELAPPSHTVAGNENATNATNKTKLGIMVWGPERSTFYGYVAAGGLAVQGIFNFNGRFLHLQSAIHILGCIAFAAGTWQHCMLSNAVLASPRGAPFTEASFALRKLLKGRQLISEYGPLALFVVPLLRQSFQPHHDRYNRSLRSPWKDAGMDKTASALQWGVMAIAMIGFGTVALDFSVATSLRL